MLQFVRRVSATIMLVCGILFAAALSAQTMTWRVAARNTKDSFFKSAEARRIGDQLLLYQRETGGWPKNIDMARPLSESEKDSVVHEKARRDDSTTDNGATNTQMCYLARLYRQSGDIRYKEAVCRGVTYLLEGQYANGGWPQFWPKMRDYQIHITYNDNAMVNTLNTIRAVAEKKEPFDRDFVSGAMADKLRESFAKGIDIILKTQIIVDGKPTVWCQQHDRETLRPAKARAYELPSFSSMESAAIVKLLMTLPNPDENIKRAIRGAMSWFDKYKLTGIRFVHAGRDKDDINAHLEYCDKAGQPLWARYYSLDTCQPFVCDRDGVPRRRLEEIGADRRNGYAWYGDSPARLYKRYSKWADTYDKENKLTLNLNSKGANENGLIDWSGYMP